MDKKRVVIIVEGGLVSEVYADDKNVDLSFIDLDTNDRDIMEYNKTAMRGLNEEIEKGLLVKVY